MLRTIAGFAGGMLVISVVTGVSLHLIGSFSHDLQTGLPPARPVPALKLGTAKTLPAGTNRPPLRVVADRFLTTRVIGASPSGDPQTRWVAVRVVIRNLGTTRWRSQPGTTATMVDSTGLSRQSATGVRVAAGKRLPDLIRLRPGGTLRGLVVFAVRRDVPITGFTLTVGPGAPAAVSWAIDHQ